MKLILSTYHPASLNTNSKSAKYIGLIAIVFTLNTFSCKPHYTYTSTTVVKPKTYHRWYDPKKDKKKKRTKTVKMKG